MEARYRVQKGGPRKRLRRALWVAALMVVSAAAAGTLALATAGEKAAEDEAPEVIYQGTTDPKDGESSPARLGCTGLEEPTNFTAYSLGGAVEGEPLTRILRRCDAPYPGEAIRANYLSYIYGDCKVVEEEGCAPPIEIQTWPACERSIASYSDDGIAGDGLLNQLVSERGVPGAHFENGHWVELYAGESTIVVFANESVNLDVLIDEVRAEPSKGEVAEPLSDAERDAAGLEVGGDLPEPVPGALEGTLECVK